MPAAAFARRYGPWGLVAGAGEGIGLAFAEALAGRGLDLILLDRDAAKVDRLADRLAAERGRRCLAVPLDLGAPDLLDRLAVAVGERDVGLVVYNAARASIGPFLEQGLEDKLAQLEVNCRGPLLLAHLFGPRLAARATGGLILMSSLAGIHGHRLTASYAATKAFNAILAEALWDEWAAHGVDVLAVYPGLRSQLARAVGAAGPADRRAGPGGRASPGRVGLRPAGRDRHTQPAGDPGQRPAASARCGLAFAGQDDGRTLPAAARTLNHGTRMCKASLIVIVVLLIVPMATPASAGQAASRYTLVADPDWTALSGARNISSVLRLVDRGVDAAQSLLEPLPWYEGVPLRLGRLLAVDGPLSMFLIWTQHEVLGHGARGREFGLDPTFTLAVPPPYDFSMPDPRTHWDADRAELLPYDHQVLLITEGQESEALLESELTRLAFVSGRWGRTNDAFLFLRLLGDMSRLFLESSDFTDYRRLVRSHATEAGIARWPLVARWALDPLIWWAFYDYFYRHLALGEKPSALPSIGVGDFVWLPRPDLRLAPWGQELGISNLFRFPDGLIEAGLLVGPFGKARASVTMLAGITWLDLVEGLDLGGRLGIWWQPEMDGCLLELECSYGMSQSLRVFGMLGVKSEGYVVGRRLAAGVYFESGIALVF